MKIFLAISLVIGIFFALQWRNSMQNKTNNAPDVTQENIVDAYMKNFTLTGMDDSGQPGYSLKADYLEHMSQSRESIIRKPVFRFLNKNRQWLVTAEEGYIKDDQHQVVLTNNVVMTQEDVRQPVKLTTQQIEIDTQKQTLQSTQDVSIVQQTTQLFATGMLFNNRTGNLELLKNVRGKYHAP